MNFFKNLQNFAKEIDPEQIQQVASFVAPHAKKFLSKNKDEEGVEADEGGGAVNFATKLVIYYFKTDFFIVNFAQIELLDG